MKALINPNEESIYISAWNEDNAIFTVLGQRICEVTDNEFPVAEPLFWIDCNNDVKAELYYYDEKTKSIIIKPEDAIKLKPQL